MDIWKNGNLLLWDGKPYPHTTCLWPSNCDGGVINIHCDQGNIRHTDASSVLILGVDLKGWEMTILFAVFSNDICAGTHEVIVSPIKGMVVGISHGPASTRLAFIWLGDTGGILTNHLTHLIGTAGDTAARSTSWNTINAHIIIILLCVI